MKMKIIMVTAFLFLNGGTALAISPYYSTDFDTTKGTASIHISGNICVAASSQTPSVCRVLMNALDNSITVSSAAGIEVFLKMVSTEAYVGTTGAHNLNLQTNGANRLKISANGNVSVGVTTVTQKFSVNGGIYAASSVTATAFYGDGSYLSGIAAGEIGPGSTYYIQNINSLQSGSTFYVSSASVNGQTLLARISGNVGIGTTIPNDLLDIYKNTTASVGILMTNNEGTVGIHSDNGSLHLNGGGVEAYLMGSDLYILGRIYASNSVGIGNIVTQIATLDIADDDITYAYSLRVGTSAASYHLVITTSTGNVGIGTATPLSLLDVAGQASFGSLPTKSTITATGSLNLAGLISNDDLDPSSVTKLGPSLTLLTESDLQTSSPTLTGKWTFAGSSHTLLNQTGKVGIGTTNPGQPLSIYNPSGTNLNNLLSLTNDYNSNLAQILFYGKNGAGTQTGSQISFDPNNIGTFINSSSTFFVANGGNVGIGTTDPTALLNIVSSGTDKVASVDVYGTSWARLRLMEGENNLQMGFIVNNNRMQLYNWTTGLEPISISSFGPVGIAIIPTANSPYLSANNLSTTNDIFGAYDAGSPVFVVKDGGNVGIGTTSPDAAFVVVSTGATTGRYTPVGWTHSSDIKFKKNIKSLENPLAKIQKVRGTKFDLKTDKSNKSERIGFVAQELELEFPEVVYTSPADGSKSIAYGMLTPVLLEAVKALKNENDELRERVAVLEKK